MRLVIGQPAHRRSPAVSAGVTGIANYFGTGNSVCNISEYILRITEFFTTLQIRFCGSSGPYLTSHSIHFMKFQTKLNVFK
jgi:hypothetical protein